MSHAAGKPLSSKVPAVKKTGSPEKDLLLVQRRQALIKTLDLLEEHPQHTVTVRDFLTQLISNDQHSVAVAQDGLFESISTLGKVDEDFMVNFLKDVSQLSLVTLGRVKSFDPSGLQNLLSYALVASPQTKIPQLGSNKAVLMNALKTRNVAMGSRLAGVTDEGQWVNQLGKLNWAVLGEFSCDVEDEVITHITHKFTGLQAQVSDDHFHVSSAFELRFNWSVTKAALVLGPRSYVCCEFFAKTSDVRTVKPWSGASTAFQELIQTANEEVETAKKGTVVRNLASEFEQYKGPLNEKKKEAAKRARKALEDNREKATKSRRVLVSDGLVVPEPEEKKD
eukprot:81733-Amphidinium_carterae.1